MVGSETSYASSRCFFDVKKTLAGQDHPITRLNQQNGQAIDAVRAVGWFNDTRGDGVGLGVKVAIVNSFSWFTDEVPGTSSSLHAFGCSRIGSVVWTAAPI